MITITYIDGVGDRNRKFKSFDYANRAMYRIAHNRGGMTHVTTSFVVEDNKGNIYEGVIQASPQQYKLDLHIKDTAEFVLSEEGAEFLSLYMTPDEVSAKRATMASWARLVDKMTKSP